LKNFREEITVEKIVIEGRDMGSLADGKKVFFYGGLPGEKVLVEVYKNKKDYALANLIEVIEKSEFRITPEDEEIYLSTSPFQISDYRYELLLKKEILKETFKREKVELPEGNFFTDDNIFHYRNKMEYSFYFSHEDEKLHLAFFKRGTHLKIPLTKESLAKNKITGFAFSVLDFLNERKIDGRKLKSLLIRANKDGVVKGGLYIKDEKLFEKLNSEKNICGDLEIIFSNPKSPASVITKRIEERRKFLSDEILSKDKKLL
jgi:23S rRNA (uracil1939-C5)-methyltransferase